MIATQHRAPTVPLIQTKGLGNSQNWCYNHKNTDKKGLLYFLWTHKDVCANRNVTFHCFFPQEPWAVCWWHWKMSNTTFIALHPQLVQCQLKAVWWDSWECHQTPSILFSWSIRQLTHLYTPYFTWFTTFGSKLWCKRWETLTLRQNS